jgi:hypothetical protein
MPTDEDIKKLEAEVKALRDANTALTSEKTKAETAKAISEAQRASILAQLPATETKALEGKLTLDGVVTEIQKLSQEALSEAVGEMVSAIRKSLPSLKTILIHNEKDLSALGDYTLVMKQLKFLAQGYRASGKTSETKDNKAHEFAIAAAPLLAPAIAGAALKSVIDLVSLFRTNVDIKGAAITFDDASLVALIAKHFRRDKTAEKPATEIIYSTLYLPGLLSIANDTSELVKTLTEVTALRQNAEVDVVAFDAKSADDKLLDPNRQQIAQLRTLNGASDRLMASLTGIDSQATLATLVSLLRGEVLSRKMLGEDTAILFVKAIGGGENRTSQSVWRSARLSHNGTAILTFLLFTIDEGLKLSDVIARTRKADEN